MGTAQAARGRDRWRGPARAARSRCTPRARSRPRSPAAAGPTRSRSTAMVTRMLRLDRRAQAGRRRRRAGAGDLPPLARRRATQPARGRRGGRATRAGAAGRAGRWRRVIAFVRGRVAALGAGRRRRRGRRRRPVVQCTPGTLAGAAGRREARLATSLVVREDSLTLYGFADDDERDVFELLQTASGVGPRLAQAMLAVHPPGRAAPGGRHRGPHGADPGARHRPEGRRSGSCSSCKDRLGAGPAPRRRRPPAGRGVAAAGATRCRRPWSAWAGRPGEADEARRPRSPPRPTADAAAVQRRGRRRCSAPRCAVAGPAWRGRRRLGRVGRGPRRTGDDRRRRGRPPSADAERARGRGGAAAARAGRVRRPAAGARAARRWCSRRPSGAAGRPTTCCCPARPGWARPPWR